MTTVSFESRQRIPIRIAPFSAAVELPRLLSGAFDSTRDRSRASTAP